MHELGHALYEQGFPASADRTPVHDAPSLGAHESQSRFWENQMGRTPAFWERLEPAMRRIFPEAMSGDRRVAAVPGVARWSSRR